MRKRKKRKYVYERDILVATDVCVCVCERERERERGWMLFLLMAINASGDPREARPKQSVRSCATFSPFCCGINSIKIYL